MKRLFILAGLSATLALLSACGKEMDMDGPAGARTIEVSITGEDEATEGLPFDPMPANEALVFLDGWSLKFDKWLVVISSVSLNQPGPDPAQQQKVGAAVAREAGPFLVDLTRPAKGDETPLFTFKQGTDGKALDTQTRYAFSFDTGPATAAARRVNVAAGDSALVEQMIQKGYSHYVEGTATHEPDMSEPFKDYPTTVKFRFGWGGTVSYLNCSNPDNGTDEEKNRGVQPKQDGPQRAVLTMHLEHPFWDKLNIENPPLRFDPIAARAVPAMTGAPAEVSLDDLAGSLITGLTDRNGKGVQDRGMLPGYTPKPGTLQYDASGVASVLNLKQFIIYSAQALAHLNGDGLCYVSRSQ
jgi:hypothetical protein